MKLITKLYVSFVLLFTTIGFSQDFVLKNGEDIQLISNTNFYVNGLTLTPSTDYLITSENAISTTSTPINSNSISRVITTQNPIDNFQGIITLFYEDFELNGISENNLELQLKNESDIWTNYTSTIDAVNNSLSYNFISPVSFSGITGGDSATLSLNNLTLNNIKIHPNPTHSIIYLNSKADITSTLYNSIGRKIKQTNHKEINLKNLASGTYLLHITDNKTNAFVTHKVVKY
ncbi:T9SS type A sorting domain-containing protein [Gaetbulibacter saemankumensis]|uniref:T9SS type A sorting domain-containing protein n=1 Tax=Gaetbulibacter saemankumensis TaxID=311208 RepID=UPI00041FCA0C|nr:T9SS type A sorting domain-containing protein [Gaetbulibacter saemankumensis]